MLKPLARFAVSLGCGQQAGGGGGSLAAREQPLHLSADISSEVPVSLVNVAVGGSRSRKPRGCLRRPGG